MDEMVLHFISMVLARKMNHHQQTRLLSWRRMPDAEFDWTGGQTDFFDHLSTLHTLSPRRTELLSSLTKHTS